MTTGKNVILFLSLFCNLLASLYLGYRFFNQMSSAGGSSAITYFQGLDDVFRKLPNNTGEIIFLGTSLTRNFAVSELFPGVRAINRGINSDDTFGVLHRLNEITESKPTKIFMEIGVNDLSRSIPVDTILRNYELIIKSITASSPTTQIYLQSLLPTRAVNAGMITEVNKRLRDFRGENITHVDLHAQFAVDGSLDPRYDSGDGLHLSGNGYLHWRDLVKEFVYN
jgi:lysophospholipase L1-like esterase